MEDIAAIKSVLDKNRILLQRVLIPRHFIPVALLFGMGVIFFCVLYYCLIRHYGDFNLVPTVFRYLSYGAIAATMVTMSLLKQHIVRKLGRSFDPSLTLGQILKAFFSYKIIHIYLPTTILIVFLSSYMAHKGFPHLIVPTAAIGLGLLYNFIGTVFDNGSYLFLGYWTLGTGLVPLLAPGISPLLAVGVIFGAGYLIFAGIAFFSNRYRTED